MKKRTRFRAENVLLVVSILVFLYLLSSLFNEMYTEPSGEEKAEIRQILIKYEDYYLNEEDINLISDLGIHIEKYIDGSYLVSKDGHTFLYDSVDDTYPEHDSPSISYNFKSTFKYLILVTLIVVAGWIGFKLGTKPELFEEEDDDEEDDDDEEEVENEEDNNEEEKVK